MHMVLETTSILPSGSTLYTTAVSLEMSDEPKKVQLRKRANRWVLQSKTSLQKWERFNNPLRLFNFWFWGIFAVCQVGLTLEAHFGLRRWHENRLKTGFLYHRCISDALSVWDSMAVNNSKSTKDTKNDSQSYQCLCVARQIIFGANWFKR